MSVSEGERGGLATRLRTAGVVPVVTLHDARKAAALARALIAGGLPMVEVVLRTPAALDAVRAIAAEVPECEVGIGTVLTPSDLEAGVGAGAAFAVSPGFSPRLLEAGLRISAPFIPAVSTAAEVLQAMEAGYELLKLFPAEVLDGPELLRQLRGPFPTARFMCTGGIALARIGRYRAEPNATAVGASFIAPAQAIAEEAWGEITARAAAAASRWRAAPEPSA